MVSRGEELKTDKKTETGTVSTDIVSNWDESVDTFDALELKPELIRGIYGITFSCIPFR
jgi:hypothetical protein